jgi:hypothetical protein
MATRFGWYRPVLAALFALTALLHGGWIQPAAADIEGTTYTSPKYEFTIKWNDNWFVMGEESTPDYDSVSLTNGATGISIYAGPEPSASPEASLGLSLSALHTEPTFTNITPLRDKSGEAVRFTDDERAFAVFTMTETYEDGTSEELAVYIEARPIAPGVYFTFYAFTPADRFAIERPKFEQVLNSFALPGEIEATATPTPERESALIAGEPAPVYVSGTWRVAVAATALNTELDGVGLKEKARKEWLVVVLDVTNWSDQDAQLSAEDFKVHYEGREKPINIAPASTIKVGSRLDLAPSTKDFAVEIDAEGTTRVVVVYSLPAGSRTLELLHGDVAISLDDLITVDIQPDDLPALAGPPEVTPGEVLSAADGNTLNIRVEGETKSERVQLLGVDPLTESDCLADETEKLFAEIAGTTVLIEEDAALTAGTPPARYVWLTNDDGTRTLLNQHLIAEGLAHAASVPADARFGLWFETTENSATIDQIGLLTGCVTQKVDR